MKNSIRTVRHIIASLLLALSFSLFLPQTTYATTSLPVDIYLQQENSVTCTLCSAAMVLRARTYLCNNSKWKDITESSIGSTAWRNGYGLKRDFTYQFDGNSVRMVYNESGALSSSSLKTILDNHPEGIILYCSGIPHAVFVTDYTGDTFYCCDPGAQYWPNMPQGRMELGSCSLSKSYGNQSSILNNTSGYWYVDSYSIKSDAIYGTAMSSGFDRALPDGDYLIATAKNTSYYLDVEGSNPVDSGTNVSLCGPLDGDPPDYDIWTLTYDNGFYTIKQKGTDLCLDVWGIDTKQEANVKVSTSNGGDNQKWAIASNGRSGYEIRPKHSGGGEHFMRLDVAGGSITSGTNVWQYEHNDSDAQSWLFIPYKPAQTLENERYILLSGVDNTKELDVPGDTGSIGDKTPVQLWDDGALSQYNSFDVERLDNGYYSIIHHASGKALEVFGGGSSPETSISLYTPNGSNAQQWAITKDGDNGGYCLRVKTSGYAMDLANAATANGSKVRQFYWNGTPAETWTFERAEYAVNYVDNDAENVPASQTKYYKTPLKIREQIPTKPGFQFVCWEDLLSLTPDLQTTKYYPGDTYTADKALELYPLWRQLDYTVTYDANGGSGAPSAQHFSTEKATISSGQPTRLHFRFLGWATSSTAKAAEYLPGSEYAGGVDITLYAVWERVLENLLILPRALTAVETEAFLSTNADAVVIPATVTSIGNNAFNTDIAIYGYSGTAAETYAVKNNMTFIPLTDDWVLTEDLPEGAKVTEEKWTYLQASSETMKSTETSVDGWTQAGYEWKQTGTGTHVYAYFPGGFDTGNALYAAYANSPISSSEAGTTKREVSEGTTLKDYIYWHWCFTDYVEDSNRNVGVEDAKRYGVQTGNVYRDYIYFDAFETSVSLSPEGMTTSGLKSFDGMYSTYHHPEYNLPEYASWWWWRIEVRQQTYTDYQKEFTYVKDTSSIQESATEILPDDGISNIQHWVKYEF